MHSKIVGGSTAKRVMACPGSVALVQDVPNISSKYADEGTLLHNVIAEVMDQASSPEHLLGVSYDGGPKLTEDHLGAKLGPALNLFDEQVDPDKETVFTVETRVGFGDRLPGVFGTIDLLGRRGSRAIVLDWKFGDGVMVDAEENHQLLFYAAAALRTPSVSWVFDGAEDVELIIIQPPAIRRWVTTFERVRQFERDLMQAVRIAQAPGAPFATGDHCRFCPAKPKCPAMTGEIDRAVRLDLEKLGADEIGAAMAMADRLETFISDVRKLAHKRLENGLPVPGWKLVPKRATRQWADEAKAREALGPDFLTLVTPAQAEKRLKGKLPEGLTVAVSSGDTIAPESDPRPATVLIGRQLKTALSKLGV